MPMFHALHRPRRGIQSWIGRTLDAFGGNELEEDAQRGACVSGGGCATAVTDIVEQCPRLIALLAQHRTGTRARLGAFENGE